MLARKYSLVQTRSQGVSLSILVVAALAFLQWQPPGFYEILDSFRWYFMLVVAGYLFLVQQGRINFQQARFYIIFNLLIWLGTLLSLFRTPNPESVLYSAVSFTIPLFLGLVMLPALSTGTGRTIWLYSLFVATLMWVYKVINLWVLYGENIRHYLYGPGNDHNLISLGFGVAATAAITFALYGNAENSRTVPFYLRVGAFFLSLLFVTCTFLSYSRSGFIIASAGMLFAFFTLFLSSKTKFGFVIIFLLLMSAAWFMASIVQITNPVWFIKFGEIVRLDDPNTSVYVRTVLLQKAWGFIQQNPFIGIGPGIFNTIYDPLIGHQSFYLVHNSYLTAWVENGVLGLFGYIFWIFLWLRFFFTKWHKLDLLSRILTMIFVPFFLMLVFLDIGGFPLHFMLIIFSTLLAQNYD